MHLLSLYPGIKLYFISPEELGLPQENKDVLDAKGIEYIEMRNFDSILDEIYIWYMTRIQKNRFGDPDPEING